MSEQLRKLPDHPAKAGLLRQAKTLRTSITARAPGAEVSGLADELRHGVIGAYQIAIAPKRAPNLRGDGILAKGMEPAPADFHDVTRMRQRSVYGLYSTISLGVTGTPMRGFIQLSEEDRWALAFYVTSLATPVDVTQKGAAIFAADGKTLPFANLRARRA